LCSVRWYLPSTRCTGIPWSRGSPSSNARATARRSTRRTRLPST
jgi:hypothetical protein